jgi:hypothetical protein
LRSESNNLNMQGFPEFALSSTFFKWWGLDLQTGELKVVLQSGETQEHHIELDQALKSPNVSKAVYDWENGLIGLVTTRNHVVFFEPYDPKVSDPAFGRPIVYLDQNHWSTVAQVMADPSRVRKKSEIDAALHLIRLAQDGGIILPVSSGHLRETGPMTGNRRYEVGVAIANFSAGWQMRHPSRVWLDEHLTTLAKRMGNEPPSSTGSPVFSLEPRAILGESHRISETAVSDLELFVLRLSSPQVLLEVLLDPSTGARGDLRNWATSNQKITDWIAAAGLNKVQKRAAAFDRVWPTDAFDGAAKELGVACTSPFELDRRERRSMLKSQPYARYLTELLVERHTISSTVWKSNDLIDLAYLCCAAGYADYVAAEAQTGTQLIQAQQRWGKPQTVHLSLESVVDAILRSGVLSATERESKLGG